MKILVGSILAFTFLTPSLARIGGKDAQQLGVKRSLNDPANDLDIDSPEFRITFQAYDMYTEANDIKLSKQEDGSFHVNVLDTSGALLAKQKCGPGGRLLFDSKQRFEANKLKAIQQAQRDYPGRKFEVDVDPTSGGVKINIFDEDGSIIKRGYDVEGYLSSDSRQDLVDAVEKAMEQNKKKGFDMSVVDNKDGTFSVVSTNKESGKVTIKDYNLAGEVVLKGKGGNIKSALMDRAKRKYPGAEVKWNKNAKDNQVQLRIDFGSDLKLVQSFQSNGQKLNDQDADNADFKNRLSSTIESGMLAQYGTGTVKSTNVDLQTGTASVEVDTGFKKFTKVYNLDGSVKFDPDDAKLDAMETIEAAAARKHPNSKAVTYDLDPISNKPIVKITLENGDLVEADYDPMKDTLEFDRAVDRNFAARGKTESLNSLTPAEKKRYIGNAIRAHGLDGTDDVEVTVKDGKVKTTTFKNGMTIVEDYDENGYCTSKSTWNSPLAPNQYMITSDDGTSLFNADRTFDRNEDDWKLFEQKWKVEDKDVDNVVGNSKEDVGKDDIDAIVNKAKKRVMDGFFPDADPNSQEYEAELKKIKVKVNDDLSLTTSFKSMDKKKGVVKVKIHSSAFGVASVMVKHFEDGKMEKTDRSGTIYYKMMNGKLRVKKKNENKTIEKVVSDEFRSTVNKDNPLTNPDYQPQKTEPPAPGGGDGVCPAGCKKVGGQWNKPECKSKCT